jgi:tungstate transport system substrate-binding protein
MRNQKNQAGLFSGLLNNIANKVSSARSYGTAVAVSLLIVSVAGCSLYPILSVSPEKTLLLATTTSTVNSGLLDDILPCFEKKYGAVVKVIPVGTGQAFEMGRRGDVDIVMVHAPSKEEEFIDKGYGTYRYEVCYNFFVLVGPPGDPAGVKEAVDVAEAMRRIYESHSRFVSRGDDSGTHLKEKELWELAGFDYSHEIDIIENKWYYSVCAGMGDTLIRANELDAYTLADEGTFWAYTRGINLEILLRDNLCLRNQYSVIPVNPERFEHVNYDLAMNFVVWITSLETQMKIACFEKNGHRLFIPSGV